MSRTLTITGTAPVLSVYYTPPILLESSYELSLLSLQTKNTVSNVNERCNRLGYMAEDEDGRVKPHVVTIPVGTYTLDDLEHYLTTFFQQHDKKHVFHIDADTITHKCHVKTSHPLVFDVEHSIGPLLGFHRTSVVIKEETVDGMTIVHYQSDSEVTMTKDFALFVNCNIIESGYINTRKAHTLHQFHIEKPPGAIVEEIPYDNVRHRVTTRYIDHIELRLETIDGHLTTFHPNTSVSCCLLLSPEPFIK